MQSASLNDSSSKISSAVNAAVNGTPLPESGRYRSSWATDLSSSDVGKEVKVAGWVHRRRDHGGLIFVDLRDRSGLIQLVFDPDTAGSDAFKVAETLRSEHVVSVVGRLDARDQANVNPDLPTGSVELRVNQVEHISSAVTPPFAVDEDSQIDELLRLKHRVTDLRRTGTRDAIILRSLIVREIRRCLEDQGFFEIETPYLTRSTPEGARDFLVPSRLNPGSWYALPQSPQLFKQLLMVAGLERYYQIVRCFRDEDLRADRQPEFTQLDAELAFVEENDVIELFEKAMRGALALGNLQLPAEQWDRITYADAMLKYGSDRPDRRFGLEINDISQVFAGTEFKVFAGALSGGGTIRGLNAGALDVSRAKLDELTETAKRSGAGGLVWGFVEEDGSWRSPVAKFLTTDELSALKTSLNANTGDLLLIVADKPRVAAESLGHVRLQLAEMFDLRSGKADDVLWVVDFPMFEQVSSSGEWTAVHHPFTKPVMADGSDVDWDSDDLDLEAVHSRAYDLVVNGWELGGGSIRINSSDEQVKVLKVLGFSAEESQERFGFLLDGLKTGAPPHGGIAFGIDRIAALAASKDSIRDVIAFPKTASGTDPMTEAPAPVATKQLQELAVASLIKQDS